MSSNRTRFSFIQCVNRYPKETVGVLIYHLDLKKTSDFADYIGIDARALSTQMWRGSLNSAAIWKAIKDKGLDWEEEILPACINSHFCKNITPKSSARTVINQIKGLLDFNNDKEVSERLKLNPVSFSGQIQRNSIDYDRLCAAFPSLDYEEILSNGLDEDQQEFYRQNVLAYKNSNTINDDLIMELVNASFDENDLEEEVISVAEEKPVYNSKSFDLLSELEKAQKYLSDVQTMFADNSKEVEKHFSMVKVLLDISKLQITLKSVIEDVREAKK